MPQSHAKLYTHLVFSTKHREPYLIDTVREDLHRYMAGTLKELKCHPVLINSVEDHVHLLFDLARTAAICDVVEQIKVGSSKWMKMQERSLEAFAWQNGYGAFSVSQSNVEAVRGYIANQQEHHRRKSFQDEYRTMLRLHEIEWDERYVWD